ncbi:aldolase/citrate lyase family protein [Chenggangzhangella methanolivorans]|uniref:aldolase/citrate lyase family protein n=1 Tax=Chenggangzhangella methanolivorans TaxID=1437009 RepID=UPI003610E919
MRHSTKLIAAAIAAAALTLLSGGQAVQAQGPIDPETWVYGPRFDDTTGGLIWNPAKKQLLKGKPVIGPTVSTTNQETMNETYCSIASQSDADFTWTEMQHSGVDWGDAWRMWAYAGSDQCPGRKAVPGARVAYTDEREIQHALDGGAMVLVVPTVDTVEEAREVVQWTYFPPMGKRSNGGSQTAAALAPWLPAGVSYRNTFNNNIVLIVMIETIEGVKNAAAIARVPGVHAVYAASGDIGNFSGYIEGDRPYERLISHIAKHTLAAGKRLCGPYSWKDTRSGYTCFLR